MISPHFSRFKGVEFCKLESAAVANRSGKNRTNKAWPMDSLGGTRGWQRELKGSRWAAYETSMIGLRSLVEVNHAMRMT